MTNGIQSFQNLEINLTYRIGWSCVQPIWAAHVPQAEEAQAAERGAPREGHPGEAATLRQALSPPPQGDFPSQRPCRFAF